MASHSDHHHQSPLAEGSQRLPSLIGIGENDKESSGRSFSLHEDIQGVTQNHYTLGPSTNKGTMDSTAPADTHSPDMPAPEPTLRESVSRMADQATINTLRKIHEAAAPIRQRVDNKIEVLGKEVNPDSHELAQDAGMGGAVTAASIHADRSTKGTVRDIGWNHALTDIPDPLLDGMSNGQLFARIRRFNKDVFDVRAVPLEAHSGLDLNDAWAPDYATEKLPLNLQRMYLTVILGLSSFAKHMARLRAWHEARRTATFCAIYTVAWFFDLLIPLLLGLLIAMVSSRKARETIFPPAPRALVNISTGTLQEPAAGQLGTDSTLTGAPEKLEGEALEEEAANFADNLRHLFTRSIGMHEKPEKEGDPLEGKVPKPVRKAAKNIKEAGSGPGHVQQRAELTQEPMEKILWDKLKPEKLDPILKKVPHTLGEIADNWERAYNAINPTPPFASHAFLRFDAILVPLFLVSLYVNYYMVYKGIGAGIGFFLFGSPILTPAYGWLNNTYPDWMRFLEPKNNLLRGVPTNNQITITLLRISEAHNTPLPPVPTTDEDDPILTQNIDPDEIPLDASRAEKAMAIDPGKSQSGRDDQDQNDDNQPKHRRLSKAVQFFKGQSKAAVETKLAVDRARAAAGSEKAKGRVGVLARPEKIIYAGPSEFQARYKGKLGWLLITESGTNPALVFTESDPRHGNTGQALEQAELTIPVREIKRLKRATAFSKRLAEKTVEQTADEKKMLGALEVGTVDTEEANKNQADEVYRFTAIPERDALYNRLVAVGQQRWENM